MNRTSKLASILVTGAAALGVVGCGSSSDTTTQAAATGGTATTQQGTSTTQQGTSTTPQGAPGQTAGRGPRAIDSTALASAAKELGTTSAKLQAALEAARPQRPSQSSSADAGPPSGDGGDPRATVYAAVAKSLGTTAAKVQTALADVLPGRGPGGPGGPGGAPPAGQTGTPPAQSGASDSSADATSAS